MNDCPDALLTMVQDVAGAFESFADLGRAWALTFVVEALLARRGLAPTLQWVERGARPRAWRVDAITLHRQARAVARAYRISPFAGTCLRRSIVQYCLGRRRGLPVELVIGVRTHPHFDAHAWLECAGASIDGRPNEGFTEIFRSPPSETAVVHAA